MRMSQLTVTDDEGDDRIKIHICSKSLVELFGIDNDLFILFS